jgi:hypothetical protein
LPTSALSFTTTGAHGVTRPTNKKTPLRRPGAGAIEEQLTYFR